jgi:hypothetical protein
VAGFDGHLVPRDANGIDYGVIVVVQAMGQKAIIEDLSDALDGIEFGQSSGV